MAALETALVGGAGVVGGWFVLRRLRGWNPDGQRLGDLVARTGSGTADLLGRVAEGTGGVVGMTVRAGGQLTAKTAGAVVGGAEAVTFKVVPGLGGPTAHDDATTEPKDETTAPVKKSRAKASKKSG